MPDNPYQPPQSSDAVGGTRPTMWLVWTGLGFLMVAALCAVATGIGMWLSFDRVARDAAPRPSDLADDISLAMLPAYGILPAALAGIALLTTGLLIRRPR